MLSLAQALKSSFSAKQAEFCTHRLNISRDSWQRGGCESWLGSKYCSHLFRMNPIILNFRPFKVIHFFCSKLIDFICFTLRLCLGTGTVAKSMFVGSSVADLFVVDFAGMK